MMTGVLDVPRILQTGTECIALTWNSPPRCVGLWGGNSVWAA
jgi:hypothetical protein